ncbi:MAG: hypothetical protein QM489_00975 [Candidatus Izemoplasma sp.]
MARLTEKQDRIVNKLTLLSRFLKENDIQINFVPPAETGDEELELIIEGVKIVNDEEYLTYSNDFLNRANKLLENFTGNSREKL